MKARISARAQHDLDLIFARVCLQAKEKAAERFLAVGKEVHGFYCGTSSCRSAPSVGDTPQNSSILGNQPDKLFNLLFC